jgi:hydrogenase maturation protein HypF
VAPYAFPFAGGELDYRPLLHAIVVDRLAGRAPTEIARAFHAAVAGAVVAVAKAHDGARSASSAGVPIVASGGVFQNALLCEMLRAEFGDRLWLNAAVPSNDGGLSLGQAASAAFL